MENNTVSSREIKEMAVNGRDIDSETQYDENGVDITLIRWMLSLTPTQRLEVLQSHINSIARLSGGSR